MAFFSEIVLIIVIYYYSQILYDDKDNDHGHHDATK